MITKKLVNKNKNTSMIQFNPRALFVAFSIMLFKVNAQEAKSNSFSLQQSIDYAIKNSPNHLNAELDLKNSIYRKREIAGAGLPQVTGSFDFKDYLEIPTSLFPLSTFNPLAPADAFQAVRFGLQYNATAGLSASQLLFSADYLFGLKAAKEFVNLSKININRSKTELVSQVTKAYYAVLVNQERLKLLNANVDKLTQTLTEVKAYHQQGFVELIDVERLEVTHNNLLVEKDKVTQLLSLGENMLKFQMGYQINDAITLTDSLNISEDLKKELTSSNIAFSNRTDVQLLNAQQSLYNIDVKRLKWGYLPTLAAYGAYQYNTQRPTANIFETDKSSAIKRWYEVALVGVTLNLNVFDGLQRHNKIQQAKIASLKNQNNLKNLELAAQLETSVATISYNNALKTLNANKRNMELAQHVYDVSQKKYSQGVGSNIEIINAQTSLRESETNYYNALYDLLISKTDYLKAIGTLVK
jgi:outer membrane protein